MAPERLNGFNTAKGSISRAEIKDYISRVGDFFGNQWAIRRNRLNMNSQRNKKKEKSAFACANRLLLGHCFHFWHLHFQMKQKYKKELKKEKKNCKNNTRIRKKSRILKFSLLSFSKKGLRSNLISMSDMEKTIDSVELSNLSEKVIGG